MPRTLEPNAVLDAFLMRTQSSYERFSALYQALPYDRTTLPLRKGLAADMIFRLGSDWEVFQHEWYIAAISKNPTKFRRNVQLELERLTEKNNLRHMLEVIQPGSTRLPDRLSAEQIALLADPEGYNVSFKDNEVWMRNCEHNLAEPHAKKVKGIVSSPEDASVLDLLRALRNAIAHGSSGSLRRLNECALSRPSSTNVGIVGADNQFLVRSGGTRIVSIPTYLHGWIPSGPFHRANRLVGRIEEVAERLRT